MLRTPLESPSAPDPSRRASAFLPLTANPVSTSAFAYTSGTGLTLYKGEFKGAFALCVVQGAEIVDENFRVTDQLIYVGAPKQYRVRYTGASSQGLPTSASIDTKNSDGTAADSIPSIALARVGFSNLAYSDLFTLNPPPGGSLRASRTALTAGSLDAGTGVTGLLEAIVSGQTARRDTEPVPVVELTLQDYLLKDVARAVQRQTGYLMCPNSDDDLLTGSPDYNKRNFPLFTLSGGYAVNLRERQDTIKVTVTRTIKPSDTARLMLTGTTSGTSSINMFDVEKGTYVQLPFQVPWASITKQNVSYFAETTGPKPVQLTLSLEDGPAVAPDVAKFHGCEGKYFFVAGAGHDPPAKHYVEGYNHSFQSQELCGFSDINVSSGFLPDLVTCDILYSQGLVGVSHAPASEPAFAAVSGVLNQTAAARSSGPTWILGYSFGAAVTAEAAIEAYIGGQPFSACMLLAGPIGRDFLNTFNLASPCGPISRIFNIPGDAVQAGEFSSMPDAIKLLLQTAINPPDTGHFYYAGQINDPVMQQRRDVLIGGWKAAGYLEPICIESQ
jgi:hypothetical protein